MSNEIASCVPLRARSAASRIQSSPGPGRLAQVLPAQQIKAVATRSQSEVDLHVLYTQTKQRLESFAECVRENKRVDEAVDFARWLQRSGILRLLESNAQGEPLKIDGAHLRYVCRELEKACTERYRMRDTQPHLDELQLKSMNQKLDTIAAYLAKVAR